MRRLSLLVIFNVLFLFQLSVWAGIDADHVPTVQEILNNLDTSRPELQSIIKLNQQGHIQKAAHRLADHLQQQAAQKYYFNWQTFVSRFQEYRSTYPEALKKHRAMARAQTRMFAPETRWQLPATNLLGRQVTAYELRHLARQQKSADMTLMYFYKGKTNQYPDYFMRQVRDLNRAFTAGEVDDGGNAVYESYRAGKRIHNWLFNYHAYLAAGVLNSDDQITLVRTFLHHGAQLRKRTKRFRYGNHQTKGLTALFEISTLFTEFKATAEWQKHALDGLVWHISREINPDGFQFERSVHYHIGDIENYFRVYQLAQKNHVTLPDTFVTQLHKMFTSLIKLAQPDRTLPVLQDDTDDPYSEFNDVRGAMTIGAILFEDPEFRFFAGEQIPSSVYWLLNDAQLDVLQRVKPQTPDYGSTALVQSGYYTMRSGWKTEDLYMTITTGLSKEKPDHQHGDMLGLVAWAKGQVILPNYQVRYKHPEYRDFKNSLVKNVALVDGYLQGRGWKPNSGKSGFGKWRRLPHSTVEAWIVAPEFDYFSATHDGFDSLQVDYRREVLFIKGRFWLVRDHFVGQQAHHYQQLWQGEFQIQTDGSAREDFANGSRLILLPQAKDLQASQSKAVRGKQHLTWETAAMDRAALATIILPLDKSQTTEQLLSGWHYVHKMPNVKFEPQGGALIKEQKGFYFDAKVLQHGAHKFEFEQPATFEFSKAGDLRLLRPGKIRLKKDGKAVMPLHQDEVINIIN